MKRGIVKNPKWVVGMGGGMVRWGEGEGVREADREGKREGEKENKRRERMERQ